VRVLLVEDDAALAGALRDGLSGRGIAVDAVGSAREAEAMLAVEPYDCMILDLGLPDRDGLDLLRDLRERGHPLPVLVLTARGTIAARVAGLDGGADDYLPKPFALPEVIARVRALMRRGGTVTPVVLRVADLELDPGRFQVTRAGTPITLTAKEFAILEYLMRHAGELVTRTTLLESCWDASYDGMSNLIDVHLSRLRRKIDRTGLPSLLHTVRGAGVILGESAR
jgi:two-component system, OmpR family, response regulator